MRKKIDVLELWGAMEGRGSAVIGSTRARKNERRMKIVWENIVVCRDVLVSQRSRESGGKVAQSFELRWVEG